MNTHVRPADHSNRFRKLRIAVSVFFGVLTVVTAILWPLSYWKCIALHGEMPNSDAIAIHSLNARVSVYKTDPTNDWGWGLGFFDADRVTPIEQQAPWRAFEYISSPAISSVRVPHWFVLVIGIACTAAPWLSPRFSLRTLLIATTLFAVVLGLAVCAGR